MTDVLEGGFGGRTLKHFDFGAANSGGDLRLGKLTRAVRQNYVEDPSRAIATPAAGLS